MKHSLSLLAGVALAATTSASAMPVYDAANHAQVKLNQASNHAQYVQQVSQLKLQLEQAHAMFKSMNGVRGMGALINNPASRQYLPKSAAGLYTLGHQQSTLSGLSGSIQVILKASQVLSPAETSSPQTARALKQQQSQLALMQATAEASYNAAGARFDTLQALVNRVDTASDPKAAADLANRINAENSMLHNEMIKLNMLAMIHTTREKQLKQQALEAVAKMGGGKPVYVTSF